MDILHFPWGLMLPWIITLLKVFGIIPGAIAANWLRKLYQRRRQSRAMEGWPSTEATIQSGRVQSEGTRHWAEITYTYFVGASAPTSATSARKTTPTSSSAS
jgi:hypothetical protein